MIIAIVSFILLLIVVFIDASGDNSKNRWKYISKDILIGFIGGAVLITNNIPCITNADIFNGIGAYILIRIGFFNIIWNLWNGQEWYFFGTTKKWDIWNRKLNQNPKLLQITYTVLSTLGALSLLGFFEIFNK